MTNPLPADILEERASAQRRRLHDSISELRSSVRERLDVQKVASRYVWHAAAGAAVLALVVGWTFTGMFTGD